MIFSCRAGPCCRADLAAQARHDGLFFGPGRHGTEDGPMGRDRVVPRPGTTISGGRREARPGSGGGVQPARPWRRPSAAESGRRAHQRRTDVAAGKGGDGGRRGRRREGGGGASTESPPRRRDDEDCEIRCLRPMTRGRRAPQAQAARHDCGGGGRLRRRWPAATAVVEVAGGGACSGGAEGGGGGGCLREVERGE
jgi:hypothetical protein